MKIASFLFGALVGVFLTYGLMPFPRVVWDGQDGTIINGTFDCVGVGARNGAHLSIQGTIIIPFHSYRCPGFLRNDFFGNGSRGWRSEDGIIFSEEKGT